MGLLPHLLGTYNAHATEKQRERAIGREGGRENERESAVGGEREREREREREKRKREK